MTDQHCIQGLESLPASVRGCALTIGNFDGVHLGHQRILRLAGELARAEGVPVVAMTFDPPPDLVLRPNDAPQRVVPAAVKCNLLRRAGCDYVVAARPDARLLSLSAEEFIDQVVLRHFAPRHVVEGPNFFFGRGRAGDVEFLRRAGSARGFGVHVAEPVRLELPEGPQLVSSTLVRRLVAGGRVSEAARCLGREFALYGRVIRGKGLGRALQYPTANLAAGEQVCPGDGVYAGRAEIAGRRHAAAVSVGTKPTFATPGDSERTIEAFLLDAAGDFYGQDMVLCFTQRLRDTHRYDTADALKAQMARDVEEVRRVIGGRDNGAGKREHGRGSRQEEAGQRQ